MRYVHALVLFAATIGLALVAAPGSVVGADAKTAKEKAKELKQKLKAEQLKKVDETKVPEKAKSDEQTQPKPAARPRPTATTPADLAKLIDEQIGQKIATAKAPVGPVCTDAEFLRRAYLDITGVIPTADQAKAFLDSTVPDKRARLVDELLASPNYGRHQADLWQARLYPKDSMNRFISKEPLVTWLDDQFNKNTPWDKFVTALVTASGPVDENPAVMFFLANRTVDKLTDCVTENFLGIQLQCAQCHNHPFTGWKQTEYWGVASFFSKVNAQNPKNANKGGDNTKLGVNEGTMASKVKDFFPESTKKVAPKYLGGPEPKLATTEPYRPALAAWMVSPDNPFFAKAAVNRTWGQLFGKGLVDPITDMHDANPASHPELLDRLAASFAAGGFDLKNLVRGICASTAYQRSSKPVSGAVESESELFAKMAVKVMSPEQLFDSLALVTKFGANRGDVSKKGAVGVAMKGGANTPRDQFVNFFLAGAEDLNPTEYEAGIPQALRLMNSRIVGGATPPAGLIPVGATPAQGVEAIYLSALARRPTADETAKLTEYLKKANKPAEGYADILWAVLNSSEFTMVR